jgi:DNA polymerase III subunit beta
MRSTASFLPERIVSLQMKISISQPDLLPALQAVSRSVGIKGALPVLGNILLETENGKLKLSATNLEIGVVKLVNANIEEEGSLTIPAKTLVEVVASLSGETIFLESQADQLKVSTKSFQASLNGIPSQEFPAIPLSSEEGLLLPASILQKAVSEITFAAAVDEGRPVLTGILTQIKGESIELVATDGFRLAHKTAQVEKIDKDFKSLIPRRTFEELVRLVSEELKGEKQEKITLATSENQNQVIFKIGQTQLSSRLIEGQFPSWEKIIPQNFVNRTILEKADLIKALKLALVFAKSESNIVKLETKEKGLKLTSEARELGSQETDIDAQVEGETVNIAINSKYLLDALAACPATQVLIEFSGNLSPVLIRPMGEEGLEYVVMPIRLS